MFTANLDEPTEQKRTEIRRLLHHLHDAAGHPSNRNLARVLRDAGKPKWVIEEALELKCDVCLANKPGGFMIPQASTFEIPKAWTVVGTDVGEWPVPAWGIKLKFVLYKSSL